MAICGILLVQEQVVRIFAFGLQTVHQFPSPRQNSHLAYHTLQGMLLSYNRNFTRSVIRSDVFVFCF